MRSKNMRALVDKQDLGIIEGCHPRTIERRLSQRQDFPEAAVGNPDTNAKVQWFAEDIIAYYEKHPDVLRHARAVVEYVLRMPRKKRSRAA